MNNHVEVQVSGAVKLSYDPDSVGLKKDLEVPRQIQLNLPNLGAWRVRTSQATESGFFHLLGGDWELLSETVEAAPYYYSTEDDVTIILSDTKKTQWGGIVSMWPHSAVLGSAIAVSGWQEDTGICYGFATQAETEESPPSLSKVDSFCEQYGITHYLYTALHLASEFFPYAKDTQLNVVVDPEIDEQWIEVSVTVPENAADRFLADYGDYNKQLVKVIPWPEGKKIRLAYDLA